MNVSQNYVDGGFFSGQSPAPKNLDIMEKLKSLSSSKEKTASVVFFNENCSVFVEDDLPDFEEQIVFVFREVRYGSVSFQKICKSLKYNNNLYRF